MGLGSKYRRWSGSEESAGLVFPLFTACEVRHVGNAGPVAGTVVSYCMGRLY